MGTATARRSQTYAPTIGAGIHSGVRPFLRSAHRLVRKKNERHIARRRLHNRWQPIHFKVSLIGLPRLFDWRLRNARAKVLGNELASPQTEIKQYVYQSKGDGMNTRISRRGFVGGTAALGATALTAMTRCSTWWRKRSSHVAPCQVAGEPLFCGNSSRNPALLQRDALGPTLFSPPR